MNPPSIEVIHDETKVPKKIYPSQKSELHKGLIDTLFADVYTCDPILLNTMIRDRLPYFNVGNLARFMRLFGKNKSHHCVGKHLPEIAYRLNELSSFYWRSTDVAFIIYGLQFSDENTPGYTEILSTMTRIMTGILKKKDFLTAQAVSLLLYGLQRNACQTRESRQLLIVAAQMIQRSTQLFDGRQLGNAMYGLQCMSSDVIEVRTLLTTLVPHVKYSTDNFQNDNIRGIMSGFQEMSSESGEVRLLIDAFATKIKESDCIFDAKTLSFSLLGLQKMKSDNKEVCNLLSALATKIDTCTEHLFPVQICNSLFSLKGLDCENESVLSIISTLTNNINSSFTRYEPQHISKAMSGIQGMTFKNQETLFLLDALTTKILKSKKTLFSADEISNIFLGLQGMSSEHLEVRKLITAMTEKMEKYCTEPFTSVHITNSMSGLKNMKNDNSEILNLLSAFFVKIKDCEEEMNAEQLSKCLLGMQNMTGIQVAPAFYKHFYIKINNLVQYEINSLSSSDIITLNKSVALIVPVVKKSICLDFGCRKWEDLSAVLQEEAAMQI